MHRVWTLRCQEADTGYRVTPNLHMEKLRDRKYRTADGTERTSGDPNIEKTHPGRTSNDNGVEEASLRKNVE